MAYTGTGTQADPWVVTTYDDLVDRCKEDGDYYVKLGANINVADNYPMGNPPRLEISCYLDGDGKEIRNFYKTDGSAIFKRTSRTVRNVNFPNIYCTSEFIVNHNGNSNYHFINCNFSGYTREFISAIDDYGASKNFLNCSFNLKDSRLVWNMYGYLGMKNCRIKGVGQRLFEGYKWGSELDTCYIETDRDCGGYGIMKNCVLNMTTNDTFTVSGEQPLSIFNSTNAPNVSADSNFAAVDEAHWTDVNYISSLGFNIC